MRVIGVDGHPLFRSAVLACLNRQADICCCAEASDIPSAFAAVADHLPDLVLTEIRVKPTDGFDLLTRLRVAHPKIQMLVLSALDEMLFATRALRLGARGYVEKDQPEEVLLEALRTVLEGKTWVSPRVSAFQCELRALRHQVQHPLAGLTDRELQVFQLIGVGLSADVGDIPRCHATLKCHDAS